MSTHLNLIPLLPELFVLVAACVTLLVGVFVKSSRNVVFYLTQVTLLIAAGLAYWTFAHADAGKTVSIFYDSFVLDRLAMVLKLFIYLSVFLTFIYVRQYNNDRKMPHNEFYVLGLLSVVGMTALVSSHSLLTLFLSVELLSLPTYAMVALQREHGVSAEAAMKYFIIGAVASGMLLYGMSLVFGATKSLDVAAIAKAIAAISAGDHLILIAGLVFIIAGLAFKLGAAPFHMWVPDVYDGAPSSVTLFIAAAPKIAGFGMLIRLLAEAFPGMHVEWQHVMIVMAILSMGIGNLAAIVQTNIKRMLAYSSIAHMGYMLLGIVCATSRGYAASMFYIITYSLMTLAGFGMILLMSRTGFEADKIDDFKGLNSRNPWLAFMMLIVMFSMAGIPPLVGFIAKVGVLEALIQAHFVWLAVVALLFAVVGAFYYLRVVKVMYFEEPDEQHGVVTCSTDLTVAMSFNGLIVLLIGVFPGALFALCHLSFM